MNAARTFAVFRVKMFNDSDKVWTVPRDATVDKVVRDNRRFASRLRRGASGASLQKHSKIWCTLGSKHAHFENTPATR